MKIVVSAPNFTKASGGIFVLHYFCYLAARLGHEIFISGTRNPAWRKYYTPYCGQNVDIVVRPETDPSTCDRTVRWVLNVPGKICGPTTYGPHEQVFWFMEELRAGAEQASPNVKGQFFLPSIDLNEWKNPGVQRIREACYYVGKGTFSPVVPEDSIRITRDYPATKPELAAIFYSCKKFLCFDDFSGMVGEARMCGCIPYVRSGTEWMESFWTHDRFVMNYEKDLERVREFLSKVEVK